jgi:hypothetical protein
LNSLPSRLKSSVLQQKSVRRGSNQGESNCSLNYSDVNGDGDITRERQTVRLQIVPEELADLEDEAAIHMLVQAGTLTPPPGRSDVEPISEEERRELADRLGRAPGKPLSEIIIEDR